MKRSPLYRATGLIGRLHHWLFAAGSRLLECLSGAALVLYGMVFLLDGDLLNRYPIYYKFQTLPETPTMLALTALGAYQLWAARRDGRGSYALILAGNAWGWIFIAFSSRFPPANTGMIFPGLLSLLCLSAGVGQIKRRRMEKSG